MKHCWVFLLLLALPAGAFKLGPQSAREAALYKTFVEGLYAQRDNSPEALVLFEKALSLAPDSAYLKRNIVATAIMQNRLPEVEKYADFITPEADEDDWTVRAAYLLKQQQVSAAKEAYQKALELSPEDARIAYQYLLLLAYEGTPQAVEEMQNLAEKVPALAPAVYVELGKHYWRMKDPQQALTFYNKATDLDPAYEDAYLGRAELFERTSNFFFMLREYEQLEKIGYKSADMYTRMGSVYLVGKDLENAQKYYQKAAQIDPGDVNANYFLAMLAEQRQDWPQALKYLQAAADYNKNSGKWLQASFYQQKMGHSQAALDTLKQAYKQFDGSVEIGYFYALALQDAGQHRAAARVLKKILAARPEYADARLAYAFTLESLKKYKEMETQLQALLAQEEDNAPAYNLWAYSLAQRNTRLEKAQKMAEKALALQPQDGSFQDTLGWVYYRRGEYARALDILQGIDPAFVNENPEIAYHLGLVYWALGQTEKARAYVVQAADGGWKPAQKFRKKHF